jgi:single-strand selective monofunctional uracil DNA glycosylase
MSNISQELIAISRALAREVDGLRFATPVAHVYNALVYAQIPHERYLARYGAQPHDVLLVGMNPGPFGMAQTGVPFGDVRMVRDFLGIEGPVERPAREHPKRPVMGFGCTRCEVSGTRLWGWARARFATAERFLTRFFVANYCPLCFLSASGANLTPDKLPRDERAPLFRVCDRALRRTVACLRPRFVVGIGAFAERRAHEALADQEIVVGRVLHPSPASPLANRSWATEAENALRALGIPLDG